ncbi:hypothetical protein HMF8227_01758 [Saliniradius amylolyticus]|uniref:Multidrug resistance protein MdtA-like barrel-sandwich hybrid domain-containing protein n=1 Tax=Saliniradius amylolyticus TaxID=2183582 RepID=A0A2S2E3K8_9ALTE|nr:efflux RND transporter periplasmic adaptor subunit [Saliniradius amylolyticus]AWL12231.1 hypothetical protein HMF8227_01758 [Saliniradius amylolyticus]
MNRTIKKVLLPIGILGIAVVIAGVMMASRQPPEKEQKETKPFLVDAEPVSKTDIHFMVDSQGTVKPKVQTVLSAQVGGKVEAIADEFIEGGMFKKGDVLVQLEQADYITELKSAEAELARASAALEEEQARGKVAEEEWRSVDSSTPPELGLRKPQLAKEKANVSAAEAMVERARRNLERTVIRAPYDGLVKAKNVDIGQYVNPGSQLGMIYGTQVAEVRLPLSDSDLAYLELPQNEGEAKVTLSANVAGRSVNWEAKLVRSEGVVDPDSRVIYAIAEVQDPYQRDQSQASAPLKFGRFVQATIEGNQAEDIVVLPRNVLRLDGTVLVVGDDRQLDIREVTVQRADERYVYVSGGLQSGDLVTSTAIPNPYEGMVVRLPDDKSPSGDLDEESATELASAGENP